MARTSSDSIVVLDPAQSTVTRKIYIEGDSDLILNKMDNATKRQLANKYSGEAEDPTPPSKWEKIITSIHWYNGDPVEFTEESFKDCLENNKPCITAFGLKKSFLNAITRNEIATYGTKLDATLNVVSPHGLIPVEFGGHFIEERIISPKQGHPILARINHFTNWKASFMISFMENVYSAEQIVNVINLAGFGCGIGSGRPSGFGRYHIVNVE